MAALPMIAQGATVTVTLTGHVLTATDGYGNLFTTTGKPTPLDNLPFTLVFTFDDTIATPFVPPPCGGAPYYSQSSGTDMSPTAILTIGGRPFTVGGGGRGETSGFWYALRYAAVPCSGYAAGAVSYSVSASYNSLGYRGASSVPALALAGASVFPASDSNFGTDYEWWSRLPSTNTDKSSQRAFGFYITYSYSSVIGSESPGDYNVDVSGYLSPETLTVSSFTACSTMPIGGGPLFTITDPVDSVPSSMPGSAICPPTESLMRQNMIACPSIQWVRENPLGELIFHNGFHVYKERKPAQQWGAECAYYPNVLVGVPSETPTGNLVPNDVPGHGTANFWPDGTCGHLFLDPGGPRWGNVAATLITSLIGSSFVDCLADGYYDQYWSVYPHPTGVQ